MSMRLATAALAALLAGTPLAGGASAEDAPVNPTQDQDPGNAGQQRYWVVYDHEAGAYRVAPDAKGDPKTDWDPAKAAKVKDGTLICFTAESEEFDWDVVLVNPSMRRAAEAAGVDMLLLNNAYPSTTKPLENADACVTRGADLVVSFNVFAEISPAIMAKYNEAKIPVIAIAVTHPGSVFIGVDDCSTGRAAGDFALEWAKEQGWPLEELNVVAGVDPAVGGAPACRNSAFLEQIKAAVPNLPAGNLYEVDMRTGELGVVAGAIAATSDWLTAHPDAKYIVSTSINDDRAYGIAQAMAQAGRGDPTKDGIVIGKNGEPVAMKAIRAGDSPFVATVSFSADQYGDYLIPLALDVLAGNPVPSIVNVPHKVISKKNIDTYYPE